MLYYSLVISKGFGHLQELLGEDTQRPKGKKVEGLHWCPSSWKTRSSASGRWGPLSHLLPSLIMIVAGWLGTPGPPSLRRDPQRAASLWSALFSSPMLLTHHKPHSPQRLNRKATFCPSHTDPQIRLHAWPGYINQSELWSFYQSWGGSTELFQKTISASIKTLHIDEIRVKYQPFHPDEAARRGRATTCTVFPHPEPRHGAGSHPSRGNRAPGGSGWGCSRVRKQ